MAFTVTTQKINVAGNQRITQYLVTADAASGVVTTNHGIVDSCSLAPVSMATAGIKLKINTNAASAAANGSIMVSSAVNGDVFFLVTYGH